MEGVDRYQGGDFLTSPVGPDDVDFRPPRGGKGDKGQRRDHKSGRHPGVGHGGSRGKFETYGGGYGDSGKGNIYGKGDYGKGYQGYGSGGYDDGGYGYGGYEGSKPRFGKGEGKGRSNGKGGKGGGYMPPQNRGYEHGYMDGGYGYSSHGDAGYGMDYSLPGVGRSGGGYNEGGKGKGGRFGGYEYGTNGGGSYGAGFGRGGHHHGGGGGGGGGGVGGVGGGYLSYRERDEYGEPRGPTAEELVRRLKGARSRHERQRALTDIASSPSRAQLSAHAFTVVIATAGRENGWRDALRWLDLMRAEGRPLDVFHYSAGINACAKGRQWEQALLLLDAMARSGVPPDCVCFNGAISVRPDRKSVV